MFHHILVPVESDSMPDYFYERLLKVLPEGAKVTLLHVTDPNPPIIYSDTGIGQNFITIKEHQKSAKKYAEHIFENARNHLLKKSDIETLQIMNDDVADGILCAIKKIKPDLVIMMPDRDASFLERLVGTRTYSVMVRSQIPILTI